LPYLQVQSDFDSDPTLAAVSGAALHLILALARVAIKEHGSVGEIPPDWIEPVALARFARMKPDVVDKALGELLHSTALTRTADGGVMIHPRLWGDGTHHRGFAGELLRVREAKRKERLTAKMRADNRRGRHAGADAIAERAHTRAEGAEAMSRKSRDNSDPIETAAKRIRAVASAARKASDAPSRSPVTLDVPAPSVQRHGNHVTSPPPVPGASTVGDVLPAAVKSRMSRDVTVVTASVNLIRPDPGQVSASSPGLSLHAIAGANGAPSGAPDTPPTPPAAPPIQPAPIPRGKPPARPVGGPGEDAWMAT